MKRCQIWVCVAALAILVAVIGGARVSSPTAHAEIQPHLGYGVNLRYLSNINSIFAPLDFEWIKVYERFGTMPTERLSYHVLYRIDISHGDRWVEVNSQYRPNFDKIRTDVRQIAQEGLGVVDAYEIGNEPNMDWQWMNQPPDPADYVKVLQIAYEAIKEVDPGAIVVSGGLGPVGRIGGETGEDATCTANSGETYLGNNCGAMDERLYAHEMFRRGAGDYLDVFGYHPVGFVYEPERALQDLPSHDNGNGFAFRSAEAMHAIMEEYGLGDKPIWATEFGWLRDPSEDGFGWCHSNDAFAGAEWYDLPEIQQANYLTRAFQYADANWPWMGAMFVWNLDFQMQYACCDPGRYFAVRKDNGTEEGTPALAYSALISMTKRPGHFGPRLAVEPAVLTFLTDVDEPGVITTTLVPLNTGCRVLTWTASVAPGMQVTPMLAITTGFQGEPLTVTVNSTGYITGTFTGAITVTATTTDVLDAPQAVPVTLLVVPEVYHVYLPATLRAAP